MRKKRALLFVLWLIVALILFGTLGVMGPSVFFPILIISLVILFWMILIVPLVMFTVKRHRYVWRILLVPAVLFLTFFLIQMDRKLRNQTVDSKLYEIITTISRDGTLPQDVVWYSSQRDPQDQIDKYTQNYTIIRRDFFSERMTTKSSLKTAATSGFMSPKTSEKHGRFGVINY